MQSQMLFEIDLLGEIVKTQAGVVQLQKIKKDIPEHYKFPAELTLEETLNLLNMGRLVCI